MLFGLLLLLACGVTAQTSGASKSSNEQSLTCPEECFCLSRTQVLCNTGGLKEIPLRTLPTTVQSLTFNKNNLTIIKPEAFHGLRELTNLSLDYCNISGIRPFAFRGLPRLKDLSIQNTPLTVISAFSFAGLQNIDYIRLSNNRIHIIQGEAFAGSSQVGRLLLDRNPLKVIKAKSFSGLTNVKQLHLPAGVNIIEPDAFHSLGHVGLLRLAFLDLRYLDAYVFRGLKNVHVLALQESDLGVLRAKAFAGLSHVSSVNIVNNKIDTMEELRITISGNLSVIGNHFPCDCRMHSLLASQLANASVDFRARNFCVKPLELIGRSMSSVDLDSIAHCQEAGTRQTLAAKGAAASTRLSGTPILVIPFLCLLWTTTPSTLSSSGR